MLTFNRTNSGIETRFPAENRYRPQKLLIEPIVELKLGSAINELGQSSF